MAKGGKGISKRRTARADHTGRERYARAKGEGDILKTPPNANEERNRLASTLSTEQLEAVATWLCLEAIQADSEEMFKLGQAMLEIVRTKKD
ncbi:MAG: hypothetical protein AAF810_24005 [Cyanobacteria bacterium P01_D01_bin.36]